MEYTLRKGRSRPRHDQGVPPVAPGSTAEGGVGNLPPMGRSVACRLGPHADLHAGREVDWKVAPRNQKVVSERAHHAMYERIAGE